MTWVALSESAGAISITPPNFYAVVASVKSTHTKSDIINVATKHGLNIFQYEEWPDDGSGYRQVAAQAQAVGASTLPWSPPWPLSVADDSHITRAWEAPPSDAPAPLTKPPSTPKISAGQVAGAVVVIGALAAGAWWLLKDAR